MLVIPFPNIDPYLVRFGELGVTWYALSYVTGIIIGWIYCNYLITSKKLSISIKQMDDCVTWMIIAIIVGGRLGHVMLYEPQYFISNPILILQTYKGGMSFHGGLLGIVVASYFFCKKNKIQFLALTDLLAVVVPFGLMLGRIANFINGELYGRITNVKWGIVFPRGGESVRHPSQLYEAGTEGLGLLILLSYLALKTNAFGKKGFLSGVFLVGYAAARTFCEFFKEPDFEAFGLTSGQLYSLPMIILGIYLIYNAYGHTQSNNRTNS